MSGLKLMRLVSDGQTAIQRLEDKKGKLLGMVVPPEQFAMLADTAKQAVDMVYQERIDQNKAKNLHLAIEVLKYKNKALRATLELILQNDPAAIVDLDAGTTFYQNWKEGARHIMLVTMLD
jgi:hypothetical protein